MPEISDWDAIFSFLEESLSTDGNQAILNHKPDPFRVLITTIISARTKDEVTEQAAARLLRRAPRPDLLMDLPESEISQIIFPAGFYRIKASNLKKTAHLLVHKYRSRVPRSMDDLLTLPGVGRKTANLVRNRGFHLKGICVDTHVHRIANRTGWVASINPQDTEQQLMNILPEKYWIPVNNILVGFGKSVCTPVSPRCSQCPIPLYCLRVGVVRSR